MSWDEDISPCLTLPATMPQPFPPRDPLFKFLAANILLQHWAQVTVAWRQVTRTYHFHSRLFFPHGASAPNGGPPHYGGFTVTLRHSTLGRIPLDERSARRRELCFTRDKHPCPPGGIRTHNTRRRVVVDPHLRPRGLWDRHFGYLVRKLQSCIMLTDFMTDSSRLQKDNRALYIWLSVLASRNGTLFEKLSATEDIFYVLYRQTVHYSVLT